KVVNVLRTLMTLLLLGGVAFAQGTGASGDLVGTVTDQSGAVVAGGTGTATDLGRGTTRTATTGSDGRFVILGLPPSTYSVSATKSGFATGVVKSVSVVIGQTTRLDFQMKVSQVSETVEVTTEPPAVETERGHQADVINQQLIEDLPINRRDYLT